MANGGLHQLRSTIESHLWPTVLLVVPRPPHLLPSGGAAVGAFASVFPSIEIGSERHSFAMHCSIWVGVGVRCFVVLWGRVEGRRASVFPSSPSRSGVSGHASRCIVVCGKGWGVGNSLSCWSSGSGERCAMSFADCGGGGRGGVRVYSLLALAIWSERHSLCAGPRVAHDIQGELLHWRRVVCRVLQSKVRRTRRFSAPFLL